MAKIHAFRALRYAPEKIPVEQVVTQPYDKISPEMQEHYYNLHPQNIVRIVLGKREPGDSETENVYSRAAVFLQQWKEEGILTPLKKPAIAVCFQRFVIPGTAEQRLRKGFIALGQLEDYARGIVFPHEKTLSGPKQDRLELLRRTRTHFEQIFMLYEDREQRIDRVLDEIATDVPDMDVEDEYGVRHLLWIVDRQDLIGMIAAEMSGKRLIIADGHHRYETALAYRDEMRATHAEAPEAPWERMPMTFFNMHSPGLTILPTHRVLSRLKDFSAGQMMRRAAEFFDVAEAPADAGLFRSALAQSGASRVTIGVAVEGAHYLLTLKHNSGNALDVAVLHQLIIEHCLGITADAVNRESHIRYVREFDAALQALSSGEAELAFLLNPTRLEQLRDFAYNRQVMPQKSTDFYPKVLSGLLMYEMETRD